MIRGCCESIHGVSRVEFSISWLLSSELLAPLSRLDNHFGALSVGCGDASSPRRAWDALPTDIH
jgi:hypothetical protein